MLFVRYNGYTPLHPILIYIYSPALFLVLFLSLVLSVGHNLHHIYTWCDIFVTDSISLLFYFHPFSSLQATSLLHQFCCHRLLLSRPSISLQFWSSSSPFLSLSSPSILALFSHFLYSYFLLISHPHLLSLPSCLTFLRYILSEWFLFPCLLSLSCDHYLIKYSVRQLRRGGRIGEFVSVYLNPEQKAVYVASDGGRVCRPLLVLESGTCCTHVHLYFGREVGPHVLIISPLISLLLSNSHTFTSLLISAFHTHTHTHIHRHTYTHTHAHTHTHTHTHTRTNCSLFFYFCITPILFCS